MIYFYVVAPSSGALRSRGAAGRIPSLVDTYDTFKRICFYQDPSFYRSVPMLTTCTTIRRELETVLYKTTVFNIYFHENHFENSTGYEKRDDLALSMFNNINIQMHLTRPWDLEPIEEGSKIAGFWSRAELILRNRTENSPINLDLNFCDTYMLSIAYLPRELRLRSWSFHDSSHKFQASTVQSFEKEMRSLWQRLRLYRMVSGWRSKLQVLAPNVNMATNLDNSEFEVRGKHVDARSVYFKVPTARVQGSICLEKNEGEWKLVYEFIPGWDDSDLDTYV